MKFKDKAHVLFIMSLSNGAPSESHVAQHVGFGIQQKFRPAILVKKHIVEIHE